NILAGRLQPCQFTKISSSQHSTGSATDQDSFFHYGPMTQAIQLLQNAHRKGCTSYTTAAKIKDHHHGLIFTLLLFPAVKNPKHIIFISINLCRCIKSCKAM